MLSLERLLDELAGRPEPSELLRDFVPPPRFANKTFADYTPRHPSQRAAVERLESLHRDLGAAQNPSLVDRLLRRRAGPAAGGVYLDGGFGVGKTHLLAAFWRSAPEPRFFLSFDELMYFLGLMGIHVGCDSFRGARLIAVDEWELDDPGNLKLALAFLRGVLSQGAFVAVTSNTLPLELGAGRFSQKDFRAEVEELAGAFEVVRVEGEDYRRRHFQPADATLAASGPEVVRSLEAEFADKTLRLELPALLDALGALHPSRFRELSRRIDCLILDRMPTIESLPDALRWVHFVDSIYVTGTRLLTLEEVRLGSFFPEAAVRGPYAKKLLRCISRMEEMLGIG